MKFTAELINDALPGKRYFKKRYYGGCCDGYDERTKKHLGKVYFISDGQTLTERDFGDRDEIPPHPAGCSAVDVTSAVIDWIDDMGLERMDVIDRICSALEAMQKKIQRSCRMDAGD